MGFKLVFDTTSVDTIADSHHVGAHTLSGAGALIDSTTIATKEWLNVATALFAGDGTTALTSTVPGALDVNLVSPLTVDTQLEGVYNVGTNANPDNVGVVAHVRNATPGDAQQTFRSTGAAATSDAVVANTIFGLDVNAMGMVYNGTTWDRLQGSSGAVHIHDGGNSITVDGTVTATTNDAALANTAYTAGKTVIAVAATPASAVASALAARKYLWLYNKDNREMYIGADVNGYPIPVGTEMALRAGDAVDIQIVSTKNNHDVRYLQLS